MFKYSFYIVFLIQFPLFSQGAVQLPLFKFTQSESNPGDRGNEKLGFAAKLSMSVDPSAALVPQINHFLNAETTKKILCPRCNSGKTLVMNNMRLFNPNTVEDFIKSATDLGNQTLAQLKEDIKDEYYKSLNRNLAAEHKYNNPKGFVVSGATKEKEFLKAIYKILPTSLNTQNKEIIFSEILGGDIFNLFPDPPTVTDFSQVPGMVPASEEFNRWLSYSIVNAQ